MFDIRSILPRGWSFCFRQEWTEWLTDGWNWRNLHLIELSYEDEVNMGQREIRFFLLGIGVFLRWCYNETAEGLMIIRERMADIEAHPERCIPWEEVRDGLRQTLSTLDEDRRTSFNVSLPDELKEFVDQQVTQGSYVVTGEYICELLRKEQDRIKL